RESRRIDFRHPPGGCLSRFVCPIRSHDMSTTLGTRTTAIPQATSQPLVMVGRTLVAFGLIGIGVTHFVFGDFMLGRAPPWPDGVPGKGLWTGASGTSVILAGIAILMGRRVRAVALFIAA